MFIIFGKIQGNFQDQVSSNIQCQYPKSYRCFFKYVFSFSYSSVLTERSFYTKIDRLRFLFSLHSLYTTVLVNMHNLCTNYLISLSLSVLHSTFADIYDEDHFISSLKDHVLVVRDLPEELMENYNSSISAIPNIRVPAWASNRYYMDEVYPILQETRYLVLKVFFFLRKFVCKI